VEPSLLSIATATPSSAVRFASGDESQLHRDFGKNAKETAADTTT
jgi:hypothetical protein